MRMAPHSPASLLALYPPLERAFPQSAKLSGGGIRSGIIANKAGYHNSRNRLLAQGKRNDYSIVEKRDKLGNGDLAAAIDGRLRTEDLNVVCRRLMAASLARDPRLVNNVREWFGSYTGRTVVGYSLFRHRPATSDSSHDWHFHLSVWRDVAGNAKAMLQVLEVLLGYPAGKLTSESLPGPKAPSSAPPKVTAPTVSLKALVAAAEYDPARPQGGTTPGSEDDVRVVEAALLALGLLDGEFAQDGAFGSSTVTAYAGWQRQQGFQGDDANGIPGRTSLVALGQRFGFKVTA